MPTPTAPPTEGENKPHTKDICDSCGHRMTKLENGTWIPDCEMECCDNGKMTQRHDCLKQPSEGEFEKQAEELVPFQTHQPDCTSWNINTFALEAEPLKCNCGVSEERKETVKAVANALSSLHRRHEERVGRIREAIAKVMLWDHGGPNDEISLLNRDEVLAAFDSAAGKND